MVCSPRERILAAITLEASDRIPTDYWGTEEVTEMLCSHLGCATLLEMYDRLGIDGIMGVVPSYIGPPLPDLGPDAYADEWGMRYKRQVHPSGGSYWEQYHYPLSEAEIIEDVDAYAWPQADWYDYRTLTPQCAQYPDRAVKIGYSALFYYHNKLRGLEQSLMDPLLRPELTHHLLHCLADTFYTYHARCYEATRGLVQITEVTDDFGSQTGPLISPTLFRLFYKPHLQRAIDLAKSFDLLVFHHDDGAIRPLISEIIGMGIDVLNPIQWRCPGMDPAELKDAFGDQLCFHGGIDNQEVMPFGAPADVRAEVASKMETLGRNGRGYVVAPCHNLQPNTPVENILALYRTAQELGRF